MKIVSPHPREPAPEPGSAPVTVEALFRSHARYVATIGYRLLGRVDEVDDLVQDVFMVAQQSLTTVREPAAVKGWLATITVRKARRRLWVRRFWQGIGLDRGDPTQAASHEPGPHTQTLLAELFGRLDKIPTEQRIAWSLRYLESESVENVARLCGCSLATAKRRISMATTLLQGEEGDDV